MKLQTWAKRKLHQYQDDLELLINNDVHANYKLIRATERLILAYDKYLSAPAPEKGLGK